MQGAAAIDWQMSGKDKPLPNSSSGAGSAASGARSITCRVSPPSLAKCRFRGEVRQLPDAATEAALLRFRGVCGCSRSPSAAGCHGVRQLPGGASGAGSVNSPMSLPSRAGVPPPVRLGPSIPRCRFHGKVAQARASRGRRVPGSERRRGRSAPARELGRGAERRRGPAVVTTHDSPAQDAASARRTRFEGFSCHEFNFRCC